MKGVDEEDGGTVGEIKMIGTLYAK